MSRATRLTRNGTGFIGNIPVAVVGGICFLIAIFVFFSDVNREQKKSAPPAVVQTAQTGEPIPRFTTYVMDMAGVIEPGEKKRMADTLAELYRDGGPQIVVATTRSLGGKSIADFQEKATFVEISGSGLRESHAHDVMITKEAPNYRME